MGLPATHVDRRRLNHCRDSDHFPKQCTAVFCVAAASAPHGRATTDGEHSDCYRGNETQRATANPPRANQRRHDHHERCQPTNCRWSSNETIPLRPRRQIATNSDRKPGSGDHDESEHEPAYQPLTRSLRLISRHASNIRKESGSKRFFRCGRPGGIWLPRVERGALRPLLRFSLGADADW